MRKPTWSRDWAGFSGGWYGQTVDQFAITILGVYHFGYFLDVTAPVIGDLRIGYQTREGRKNPYLSPSMARRGLVWNRRSMKELREAEAEAQRFNEARAKRMRRLVSDD